MPPKPMSLALARQTVEAVQKYGSERKAASALAINYNTFRSRHVTAKGLLAAYERGKYSEEETPLEPLPELPVQTEAPPEERFNAAFWKKKAAAVEKEVDALHATLRALGGLDGIIVGDPTWIYEPKADKRSHAVGILHTSDRHIGERVDPKEINGWNEYNLAIAQDRIRRHVETACQKLREWTDDTTLDGVIYTMGGDEISGDIHDELIATNELTSLGQVQEAVRLHVESLNMVLKEFGRVHVMAVPGNHGRTTKKSTAKKYGALSYDVMIAKLVAEKFQDAPGLTFDIADGPDVVQQVYGRNIVLTHGDKIGTGGGQGFAGPELPMLRGSHKLRQSYASVGMVIDLILGGHFHTSANLRGSLFNGSVVGYSEFAQQIRAPMDEPKQWVALYRSKWGLSERLDVRLAPKPKPKVRIAATAVPS